MSDEPIWAVDTSVAVPFVHRQHREHELVTRHLAGRRAWLAGHAEIETFSVLTRLPAGLAGTAHDVVAVLAGSFVGTLHLEPPAGSSLAALFAEVEVAGGAVYDGLVALAAHQHDAVLLTRDHRARNTYARIGVRTEVVA